MFELKQLYGGTITALLPPNSCDISKLRDVPDNQEVFAHSLTDQSIIFDLLEYTNMSDSEATEFHFKELTSYDSSEAQLIRCSTLDSLGLDKCDAAYYLVGKYETSKYKETAKNQVDVHMVLLRYKTFATDIVITFNDPTFINPESCSYSETTEKEKSAPKWTGDEFMKTIQSFTIVDFSLFNAN